MAALIQHTPLSIGAHAVRTCWQSFGRGDNGGQKDQELVDRVGNKFKHSSTLEHLRWTISTEHTLVAQVFKECKFSTVTGTDNYVISTNVRAFQNLAVPASQFFLAPPEYLYLLSDLDSPVEIEYPPIVIGPNIATLLYHSDITEVREVTAARFIDHLNYTFYVQDVSRALLQELARHRIASLSVKSTRYTLKELKDEMTITEGRLDLIEKYCVLTGNSQVDKMIAMALGNLQFLVKQGIPNDVTKFALPGAYKTELTWSISARSLQNFLYLRTAPSAMWEIRRLAYAVFDALPEDHKQLYKDCVHATQRPGEYSG